MAGLHRFHSHLIACHMKSFVFCHRGSTGDSTASRESEVCAYISVYVCVCVCVRVYVMGRQMSFNTCNERETLKDAAALLSSCVHRRKGLWNIPTHTIWNMHTVTHCEALRALPSARLKSGWTLAGKPH